MHTRRLSAFVLAAWMAGMLFMMGVATQNFRRVDRLLESPPKAAAQAIETLGHDRARALFRYHSSELNRFYFETWEYVQIGLGLLLGVVLLFATNANRGAMVLAVLMLLIVLAQRLLLTAEIVFLGREIDFVPVTTPSPERDRFWNFHMAYSASELFKLLLGSLLALKLLVKGGRRGAVHKVDAVDHPDHSHVNR